MRQSLILLCRRHTLINYLHKKVAKGDMTKEKLDIGSRVYERKQTAKEATEENGVTLQTVYHYAREYMKSIGVDPLPKGTKRSEPSADYRSMTKKELINELMLKDLEAERNRLRIENSMLRKANGLLKKWALTTRS